MGVFRVTYLISEEKRVIVIDSTKKEDLKQIVRLQTNVDRAFEVKVKDLNAYVSFTDEVFEGDELLIEFRDQHDLVNAQAQPKPEEDKQPDDSGKLADSEFTKKDIEDAFKDSIKGKNLLQTINEWTISKKFKVKTSEGEKKGKKGVTRTFQCSEKQCDFKLRFFANYEEDQCEIDSDELVYSVKSCFLEHNHQLNYSPKDEFTEEIVQKIDKLKGNTKSLKDLQEVINRDFNTKFEYYQIVYQVNEQNFGKPNEDADSFIKIIETDINTNGGFYDILLDKDNRLQKVLYISKQMLEYSEMFLDIIFVDSTYRRNRFNMPLFNVCGINNFGKTIMLAFAVLNNETKETYDWVFSGLRRAWKSNPAYIISDESQEIIHGKS